jgi:predicted Co/Zn/Cd cation transporter (cation efflux family)
LLSIIISSATLIAELIGGLLTGSLALLSDAAHVFLDIFALALSYGAVKLAERASSGSHSYGFARMKVIAAFIKKQKSENAESRPDQGTVTGSREVVQGRVIVIGRLLA